MSRQVEIKFISFDATPKAHVIAGRDEFDVLLTTDERAKLKEVKDSIKLRALAQLAGLEGGDPDEAGEHTSESPAELRHG